MTTNEIINLISLLFAGIAIIISIIFGCLNLKKSKKIEKKVVSIQNNITKTIKTEDKFDIKNVETFDNRKSIK